MKTLVTLMTKVIMRNGTQAAVLTIVGDDVIIWQQIFFLLGTQFLRMS